MFVVKDTPSASHQEAITQIDQQAGVVGAGYQIEITIAIEIAPVHGICGPGNARKYSAYETILDLAGVPPVVYRASPPSKHHVEQTVAIHIHQVDRSGVTLGHGLLAKGQLALVPQDRIGISVVGQHNIQIVVTVKIADGHTRAVGFKQFYLVARRGGDVIQIMRDENACTWLTGFVERP